MRSELSEIKKECHKRKKLLAMQQHLLHNSSLQQGGGGITGDRNQCPFCQKRMISEEFLETHVGKHHSEKLGAFLALRGKSAPQIAALEDKEHELMELKNRLNQREQEMNALRAQMQVESSRKSAVELNQELEARLRDSQNSHERELQKLREAFSTEMRDLNSKLVNYERLLLEARSAPPPVQSSLKESLPKNSHLGELRDDEVAEMRRQHEAEMRELRAAMSQKFNEVNRELR